MTLNPAIEAQIDLLGQYYYSRPFDEKLQKLFHEKVRDMRSGKQSTFQLIIKKELEKEHENNN